MTGYLGRRTSELMSDADVYAIVNPSGERRYVRVEVSAIPNMDIVVDIVRAGQSEPVLSADGARVGEGETVPAFPVRGADYLLRVRERWVTGVRATENVSDPYTIRWDFVIPEPDEEQEVNDALELAGPIRLGESKRGHIGWGGDVDSWCLDGEGGDVVATVTAVEGLNLVLTAVDRVTARRTRVDAGGAGEGEQSEPIRDAAQGRTCFLVEADATQDHGAASEPAARYTLTLGPAPQEPEASP